MKKMTVSTDKDYIFREIRNLIETRNELIGMKSEIPQKGKDGIYTSEWLSIDTKISAIDLKLRYEYEELGKEIYFQSLEKITQTEGWTL